MKNLLVKTTMYLAGDPFEATKALADSGVNKIRLIAAAIFVLVLAVTGLLYSFGGREMKATIKKKWVDVLIAAIVVFGATMFVTFLIQFVQQSGFQ